MNRIAKSLVLLSAVAAVGSADASFGDMCPYVGVDYYHAWMKGKNVTIQGVNFDFAQFLPKSYPGAAIYIGGKFHENFGLELGAFTSARKKRDWTFAGDTGTTRVRRSGAYLDLVGYLPMNDCFDLLGTVGVGWVKPKVTVTTNSGLLGDVAVKGKAVARVGVGASYMVTDCVGLRAKVGWESTNALRIRTDGGTSLKAFKSSGTLNVGVFFKF